MEIRELLRDNEKIFIKYLPVQGEGLSKASQIVTAVHELLYGWFINGDVYETHAFRSVNDLSSFANWLNRHTDASKILKRAFAANTDEEYEEILKNLVRELFDQGKLELLKSEPKAGCIYECRGPFRCEK